MTSHRPDPGPDRTDRTDHRDRTDHISGTSAASGAPHTPDTPRTPAAPTAPATPRPADEARRALREARRALAESGGRTVPLAAPVRKRPDGAGRGRPGRAPARGRPGGAGGSSAGGPGEPGASGAPGVPGGPAAAPGASGTQAPGRDVAGRLASVPEASGAVGPGPSDTGASGTSGDQDGSSAAEPGTGRDPDAQDPHAREPHASGPDAQDPDVQDPDARDPGLRIPDAPGSEVRGEDRGGRDDRVSEVRGSDDRGRDDRVSDARGPADRGRDDRGGSARIREDRGRETRDSEAPGGRTRGGAGASRGAGGGGARTWWGDAWIAALERGALDPARLARGRAYAGRGQVGDVSVTPGRLLAYVQGSRPRPYRAQIRVRVLPEEAWEEFLNAAAEQPGHIAALLDKDLPHSLAEHGPGLLPGPGDLEPHCSCPDSGRPCKHAAALCYRTARLLDEDPFLLLLLRGRGERELLDTLARRHATRTARAAQDARGPSSFPGMPAEELYSAALPGPLPPPLAAPKTPEHPPAYPSTPGGPDPLALDQLATDAAARAHALLTTGRDPVADLTLWQDAVRLAAARPGSGLTAATRGLYADLAEATGRSTGELARAVAAWRQGGAEGLAVLEEPWDPPAGRFDRARPALLAAGLPVFRPWHNRLTHPLDHLQLRLGREGLWYGYESEPGRENWWPRGEPGLNPVDALSGLIDPHDHPEDSGRHDIALQHPYADGSDGAPSAAPGAP